MSPRAADALLALGLAAALVACGSLSGVPAGYDARPGPHDRLGEVLPEEVAEVQRLRAEERLDTAVAFVRRLAAREEASLPLARLQQDVELEAGGEHALLEVRARARERLEAFPDDLVALLLAARVEADPTRARALIDRALELEPACAWTHYALAHLEAQDGRWGNAAEELDRALSIDPGHLWARRLQTQLHARGGPRNEAIDELERWLHAAGASPFFQRAELDAARLDLAHELVLDDRPGKAAAVLATLDDATLAGAHAQQLAAAIEQAEEHPEQALEATLRAQEADPDDPLAHVQQAMLAEDWLARPDEARAHWQEVLDLSATRADLGSLLLSLRARAALERLDASAQARGASAPRP